MPCCCSRWARLGTMRWAHLSSRNIRLQRAADCCCLGRVSRLSRWCLIFPSSAGSGTRSSLGWPCCRITPAFSCRIRPSARDVGVGALLKKPGTAIYKVAKHQKAGHAGLDARTRAHSEAERACPRRCPRGPSGRSRRVNALTIRHPYHQTMG